MPYLNSWIAPSWPYLGYLPQDELFDGSIAENIARFGEVDSNRDCCSAQRGFARDDFAPPGPRHPMGEAGGLHSVASASAWALARALYGKPP